jgi:hypothetical protein
MDTEPTASMLDTLCLCEYEDEDGGACDQPMTDTLCLVSYDEDCDGGVSLEMYNQLRGQLASMLAAGGAADARTQAQMDRLRAAMFHSLAVAFPAGLEPVIEDAEGCDEDDVLCWVY